MTNNIHPTKDLLIFYFISLASLLFSGLLYKVVFVLYNGQSFSAISFSDITYALFWGMRFDLASAAFFSLLGCLFLWCCYRLLFNVVLPKNLEIRLLAFMLLVQMSLQIGDAMYYAESGRHVSYEMRDALTDASGLFLTAVSKHTGFIVFSYLLSIIVIYVVLKISRKIINRAGNSVLLPNLKFNHEIKLLVILIASIIFVRGGVAGVPQSVIHAFKIGNAQQAVLTMNGAYSVVYGVVNSSKEVTRIDVALPAGVDIKKIMRSLYPQASGAKFTDSKPVNNYNLIYILLESWPAEWMSSYGYQQQTTPFYSSLKENSLSPVAVIAGGSRTTEGIYATFCSQQNPLGETIAQTSLQNFQYSCLPEMLKSYGWSTAFFQGTNKETSGTGAFAQRVGFTESYAKRDFPESRYEHNSWGVHDPDIYDFLLDKLDSMPEPFLIGLNTNSTHDIQLPEGVAAAFGGNNSNDKYLSVLHFSDQALQEFFQKIREKPYYKNTIFVVMSDHTGGTHKNTAAKYMIPGIIYSETLVPADHLDRYVSQRDITPTILDILEMPASRYFTGKSFWPKSESDQQEPYFADYYDAGTIGWLSGYSLVETSVINPDEKKCYSLESGLLNTEEVTCNKQHEKLSLDSLVFTSYSQQLLFHGDTMKFYEFAE